MMRIHGSDLDDGFRSLKKSEINYPNLRKLQILTQKARSLTTTLTVCQQKDKKVLEVFLFKVVLSYTFDVFRLNRFCPTQKTTLMLTMA